MNPSSLHVSPSHPSPHPALEDPALIEPEAIDLPSAAPGDPGNNPRFRRIRSFHSRFLPDDRDVLIYLPEAYLTEPHRRFPVFYLHDGQNLFDPQTSFVPGRTWRAHTTADRLTRDGLIQPVILVGIANTGFRRMAEYTPVPDRRHGGGEGPLYGRLLVEDLLPTINANFRTLTGPTDTALGGSSLGGLISLFLGLEYPNVFAKLAVMSPSIWWSHRAIFELVSARVTPTRPIPRPILWLDTGLSEGLRHVRDIDLLHHRLVRRGWRDHPARKPEGPPQTLRYLRVPHGVHDEHAWAARFDQVLQFLFPAQG
ncbi:MAG: alpha/beta hydrolase-fold protein [Acidobacteriota bacterium]